MRVFNTTIWKTISIGKKKKNVTRGLMKIKINPVIIWFILLPRYENYTTDFLYSDIKKRFLVVMIYFYLFLSNGLFDFYINLRKQLVFKICLINIGWLSVNSCVFFFTQMEKKCRIKFLLQLSLFWEVEVKKNIMLNYHLKMPINVQTLNCINGDKCLYIIKIRL